MGGLTRPLCDCHGLPKWKASGGRYQCQMKRREYNRRRNAQRVAWMQTKRDTDPIFRIGNALKNRRYSALQRKAKRHLTREERGPVQEQGRDRSSVEPDTEADHS